MVQSTIRRANIAARMKIETGSVVTIAYDICTEDGEIVESSEISGPVTFVQGKGAIIPGLDAKLVGMEEGEERTFTFAPEEAFGRPEDAPRRIVNRKEFPKDAKLGKGVSFDAGIPGGHRIRLEVAEVADDRVTVRLIHPLAGKTVNMSVAVHKVREATPAERESGKVVLTPPPPPKAAIEQPK
jgi:FKBP-type peptidyl-prolyl cis-trans isomerase 2